MKKGSKKKVVVIGGGTGSFVVLSGLKNYDIDISAIVCMSDDGGSTGILRDELGALPPGDVRQCLVALSESTEEMLALFNYRFGKGRLLGHNFGNLLLTALEKTKGNFSSAVKAAEKILKVKGKVIPVTLDDVRLSIEKKNGKIIRGENKITKSNIKASDIRNIYLEPKGKINPEAKEAIEEADLIVIAPSGLYTSLAPNLLVKGMDEALKNKKGKVVYVCNLVNKPGSTDDFTISDYLLFIEGLIGREFIDYILFNDKRPKDELVNFYTKKGELLVQKCDLESKTCKILRCDLIDDKLAFQSKGDVLLERNLIRHNKKRVAKELMKILEGKHE